MAWQSPWLFAGQAGGAVCSSPLPGEIFSPLTIAAGPYSGPWFSIKFHPQHKNVVLKLAVKAGLGSNGPKTISGSLGLNELPVSERRW